ncbi:DUF4352 domain-containing protein [Jeotgalibacillus haloalkalitolerans]|uniref:DUF4352 domain-containing protein n=1 Tax=Jeotgalibacillus haloalkalitolerans TaxID=3104292 RepID=A0ABU5KQL1_9BACL|nr:DUF4352 domain-containing protein [Jeotgalibacillus sp. HH7-29]MDZ5713432.1 DUF4352 domain-containing protein [Jeotgalibacillus sp. HH7-29]
MKKFWLVSAMAAALMLAACSDESSESAETEEETATEEAAEETEDTSAEESESEESAEPELYLVGDEVTAGDITLTVTDTGVAEQIDDTNRMFEINMTVTNNGEEEVSLSSEDFTLTDLSDEEKTAYGDPSEWTIAAGETAEGSLQYESASTTAFKLLGTIGEEEVEWRLPGITSLD